ncbi:glycosyltransferase family 2 protein [Halobacillus campisalis]|uniref:Glycosyltransferase family 2 protein n=1 Tax=Halobacillus campisalis TaxID=435909 RepID=A0ABW2K8Z9_9BACI|nr:glycosyltransferase family 2 protein [Halobacillus campisalis]
MNPAISIIVPVYNVEPYLRKCLNSILAQTFTDFEVIVVNDGSTDGSGEICDEFSKNDIRVKVIHEKFKGVSSARNTGVRFAQGEYIGFVDSDDRVEKEMYKKLYRLCIDSECDISICRLGREIDGKLMYPIQKGGYIVELSNEEAMKELFKGELYRFSLCNKLFKRDLFEGVNFPEGRIHEDMATTYKLFEKAKRISFIDYSGYIYVKRQNSILTKKYNSNRLDSFKGWEEIINFMKERYPQLSNEYLSSFVYWTVDNSFLVLNQVDKKRERNEYLNIIQNYAKPHCKNILLYCALPMKYKYLFLLISFFPGFLNLQYKLKRNSILGVFKASLIKRVS